MKKRLTPENEAYLIEHYATTKNSVLSEILGVPESNLRVAAMRLKLKKNKDVWCSRVSKKNLPPREIIISGASMIVRYN